MNKNIKATNMELTPAISEYLEKRFAAFDRFIQGNPDSALCDVEVGKTTNHHKNGDIFRAEVNLRVNGEHFYAVSEKDDLYAAIDEVKDEVVRLASSHKEKSETMLRKGALRIKHMLKGLDWRTWK